MEVLAFDSKRYVGAQIGIHGPTGEKVGEVRRLRNVEYLFLAGEPLDELQVLRQEEERADYEMARDALIRYWGRFCDGQGV